MATRIVSCFSGVGGLEGSQSAVAVCESDEKAQVVLSKRYPETEIHSDVTTFRPPPADVVLGGWPCQDISVAGKQAGLRGERSGLFYELLRVAEESNCRTLVAENVVNILRLDNGDEFVSVLEDIRAAGFEFISWRVLNARNFGIPHQRRRVFLVASKSRCDAESLHRALPAQETRPSTPEAAGFYWTAGLQSICYSEGFSPTLKVGSSLSIPSPPAVHLRETQEVRTLTSGECLRLQGFDPSDFESVKRADRYRMAGNAVTCPVGRFVVDGVVLELGNAGAYETVEQTSLGASLGVGALKPLKTKKNPNAGWPEAGELFGSQPAEVLQPKAEKEKAWLAADLLAFLDPDDEEVAPLSVRAATGLLARLEKSQKDCPPDLLVALKDLAA
jgi:DNA (cytosine-5)-methyltransferase 1